MIRASSIAMLINSSGAFNVDVSSKFVKEAEIKHGRVAMLSSVTIPLLDTVSPDHLGVDYVNSLDVPDQLLLLGIFGCSEVSQMMKAYDFPSDTTKWFRFKESHEPGDYGFDPLYASTVDTLGQNKSNELFIGRLAMIGAFSEMLTEFCFKTPIIQ